MGLRRPVLLALTVLLASGGGVVHAASPPAPSPDPAPADQHIFYGAVKPGADNAPVIVFVHGLAGVAHDWWVLNDMYDLAYEAGFRTAFVSLSLDNTRNHEPIAPNALVLRDALPTIVARYRVSQVYVVAHSKGGVDVQAAMLDPRITHLAKAVFTIASPNSGTELADWAFGAGREVAEQLDALMPGVLLSPGLLSLTTGNMEDFRRAADPYLASTGVPFYTTAGDTSLGNPLLEATGRILKRLSGGGKNDGLVPVARAGLPTSYASDLGDVAAHHFRARLGSVSFWRIVAEIQGLERDHGFHRVAGAGFGDPDNAWPWFAEWFKGKLYVGTGRAVNCVTFATAFVQTGARVYPPGIGDCPADIRDLRLAAEIWRYTPETRSWQRVFRSPEDIPIGGQPMRFVARDIGFRGATTFTEPGGQEALYVSGVSASSLYEDVPRWANNPQGYPPPRILRTVDGVNWSPIPQRPGTFLGDIVKNSTSLFKARGFRTMEVFDGRLFVVMTDYRGVGVVLASSRPWAGNNAWSQVSPPAAQLPVWTIRAFNGFLYAGTGDRRQDVGYGVWKTDAVGPSPVWLPVVTRGGWQAHPSLRSPNVLNMMEFEGKLYVGTDRPTELIRVNPDDSWDLLVGARRLTPDGMKKPISTLTTYFGNTFNGHFWNLGVHDGALYLGTWDWSVLLQTFGLIAEPFRSQFGFNLYRTEDGLKWELVSHNGMDTPWNYGVRSLEPTPFGFFIGAAKPQYGLDVWLNNDFLDLDEDGDIDQGDVDLLTEAIGEPPAGTDDPRDMDEDGQITEADAILLATQCTERGCQRREGKGPDLSAPDLSSVSRDLVGRRVNLYWQPVPGAVRYRVYKQPVRPLLDFVPEDFTIRIPGTDWEFTLQEILDGALDSLCGGGGGTDLCAIIDILKALADNRTVGFPDIARPVDLTTATCFQEDPLEGEPPDSGPPLQSVYYVRAEDAEGQVSPFSNIVGGPSEGYPLANEQEPPTITPAITPPPNADGWNNTPVEVAWQLTNGGPLTGCDPRQVSTETAGTDLTCSATSLTCVPESRSVTVRIDQTPPTVSFGDPSPSPNAAGWHNSDVSMPFEIRDALSGPELTTGALVVAGEGAGLSEPVSTTDRAGNGVEAMSPPVRIDQTPPTVSFGDPSPTPNAAGWHNSDVSIPFEIRDALSGPELTTGALVVAGEGAGLSEPVSATDRAGNGVEAMSPPVRIDRTPPTVSFGDPSPSPNAAGWHNSDVSIPFEIRDALSGPELTTGALVVAGEGAGLAEPVSATDRAGNGVETMSPPVRIDRTPPSIVAHVSPPPDAHGRHRSRVSVTFGCTDALSGVLSCGPSPQIIASSGTHSVTAEAFDEAGNRAELTVTVTIVRTQRAACVQFDHSRRTVVVTRCDARSGAFGPRVVPASTRPVRWSGSTGRPDAKRRRYEVHFRDGDLLELEIDVFRRKKLVRGRVVSVAYNGIPQSVPANNTRIKWKGNARMPRGMTQKLVADVGSPKPLRINASYRHRKRRSTVNWLLPEAKGPRKDVVPGLALVQTRVTPLGLLFGYALAKTGGGAPSPNDPAPCVVPPPPEVIKSVGRPEYLFTEPCAVSPLRPSRHVLNRPPGRGR